MGPDNKKYGTVKPAKKDKKLPDNFLDVMRSTGTGFNKEELRGIKEEKKSDDR